MTGEDDAASGFSSPSSSMAAMMPDEEDEEEPIFEEDTAIGTSAGSCVDPPAEEGQCDLRRLLEEAGWPAACYNGLDHVQTVQSPDASAETTMPGGCSDARPVRRRPQTRKKRQSPCSRLSARNAVSLPQHPSAAAPRTFRNQTRRRK
eukprot:g79470.t1